MDKVNGKKRKWQDDSDVLRDAPREIRVLEYVESRASEIQALQTELNQRTGNRLVLQILPKGLRRRALSHNIKRLPRRLREAAKKLYENQSSEARRKPPSRKFRRRPKNLLEEYNRRKQKHVWLETHIWHAKRFRMAEKWGYRIPLQPTDKSRRAAYRSTQHHCLIQDISYMCCIELRGPEQCLLDGLSHMTNTSTGQTFAAKSCLSGIREGHTVLYACDKYPLKAVGYASFLWQPLTCDSVVPTPQRRLWLWVHPTCHGEVCQELEKSFPSSTETPSRVTGISMETVSSDSCKAEVLNTNNDKSVLEVQNEKMEVATKPLEEKSTLRSFSGSRETLNDSIKKPSVTVKKSEVLNTDSDKLVIEVKNDTMEVDTKLTEINSTLTCVSDSQETLNGSAKKPSVKGNKSDSKLKKSKVKKSKKSGIKNPKKNIIVNWKMSAKDVEGESLKDCLVRFRLTGPASQAILSQTVQVADIIPQEGGEELWWQNFYSRDNTAIGYTKQRELWDGATKCRPGELTPHMVLGLTVGDPRVLMPDIRTKAKENQDETFPSVNIGAPSPDTSASAIWDPKVRSEVKQTKLSDHQLNQLKSEHLIPGTPLDLGIKESRIPLLLIQNPGARSRSRGQCDAVPGYGSGWDIVLPAGWSMAFWVAFNYRCARAGGLCESESIAHEQSTLLFPQGYPDTTAGSAEEKELYQQSVDTYNKKPPAKRPNYTKLGIMCPYQFPWKHLVKQWAEKSGKCDQTTCEEFCVVRDRTVLKDLHRAVSEVTNGKLSKKDKANLFTEMGSKLHQYEQLRVLGVSHANCLVPVMISMVSRGCPEQFANICIPTQEDFTWLASDPNSGGPMGPAHKDTSKVKKKDKKKAKKRKLDQDGIKSGNMDSSAADDVVKKEQNSSDLPVDPNSMDDDRHYQKLVDSSSRQIIGYVKEGGFALGRGSGRGTGFVSLVGFLRLLDATPHKMPCIVLVRNPTSYQYRYANINILQ